MAYADVFAILCLISNTMVVVFLLIAAITFYNLTIFNIPSTGQSTFMFATAIVLAFICLVLGLYAVWKIFSYRPLTVIETNTINTHNAHIQSTITNQVVSQNSMLNPTLADVQVANVYGPSSIRTLQGIPLADQPGTIIPPPLMR